MAPTTPTTIVSTKGQVILPKSIRRAANPDGVLLKPLTTIFPPTRPEDVFAFLRYTGRAKSLQQMEAGITAEAKRRHARDRH
jgi:bifunctional DNA-binding transcriptional regulator/antitoxin component of YhaV-PrlF toxin-antitoxin module